MRAAHARAIRLLARSPGIHDLRERVKMATTQPKVLPNHSCKLFAAGDWRNSLLETERRTGSDKLKWRLAVVSEGSAETRRYILLVGRFWIFRRSAPLWIGPQRCGSKFGCRSAMLSQRSPGFFFDERVHASASLSSHTSGSGPRRASSR